MPPVIRMPQGTRPVMPRMPPQAYKSYVIRSPRDVEVRTACEDAGCLAWRHGWDTVIDERTTLGKSQGDYIRQKSGRAFRELATEEGVTVFRFEAGQRCFADHKTRPELYVARGGDFRGNPSRERRVHKTPADWLEDFGLHQQRLVTAISRG